MEKFKKIELEKLEIVIGGSIVDTLSGFFNGVVTTVKKIIN